MCEMSLNLIAHRTAHHSPGEREYGNPKRTKLSTIFMVKTWFQFHGQRPIFMVKTLIFVVKTYFFNVQTYKFYCQITKYLGREISWSISTILVPRLSRNANI